jgi:hypothetical protein
MAMRIRGPLLVLLASALGFLASLYLPWRRWEGPVHILGPNNAWKSEAGAIAGIFALVLAIPAAAALARPALAGRIPAGRCALAMAYFGVAAYLQVREPIVTNPRLHVYSEYGVYVSLASVVVCLLGAAALQGPALLRRPTLSEAVTAVLAGGLLVAYLLRWQAGLFPGTRGIDLAPLTIGAVAPLLGANLWRREAGRAARLVLAVGVAVLTGAAAGASPVPVKTNAVWVALGMSLALVAVAAVRAREWRPSPATPRDVATIGASVLLAASLFLPWTTYGRATHSLTVTGWATSWGAIGGSLALVAVALVVTRRLPEYVPELGVAVAVSIGTVGAALSSFPGHTDYGAYLGFVAAGLLMLLQLRRPSLRLGRLDVQIVAVAACVAYLGIALVPMWVFSIPIQQWSPDRTFWLTVAGTLLALHLLNSWVRPPGGVELVLVPLGLLVLLSLDLVQSRSQGMGWGGVTVVLLCVTLAVLGWIERNGPRRMRIPAISRVDRLPGAEA